MVLPLWIKGGKPISLQLVGKRYSLPLTPLIIVLVLGVLFLSNQLPFSLLPSSNSHRRSPFVVPSNSFLPPPETRPPHLPAPLSPKKSGMVIPNSLHYVYGLKPVEEGKEADPLPYYAYLAIRSAMIHLKPEKIYFHLPTGPWWRLLEPSLTLIKTEAPNSIMGKPLEHFAHKADVLRLLALKHSGGIYLDIDMFVVKPFDDLLYFPTTMGWEASPDSRRGPLDPEGLCNAVIIAAPGAPFLDRWLLSYETYDEYDWAGHSVRKPWELARQHPEDIQVLNSRAFFWPMWHGEEIKNTHERNDYDFIATGQYAYHAWESLAMQYLSKLSPHSIRTEDSSFHRLVRPFVGPKDDEVFKEWEALQHGH